MHQRRFFTLGQANAELPWLRTQLYEIDALRTDLARHTEQLQAYLRETRTNGHGDMGSLVTAKQAEERGAADRLTQLVQEVNDRGIILRDVDRGLVDFPSLREGREVCLCWLKGEETISFWHEVDAGFAGRRPL